MAEYLLQFMGLGSPTAEDTSEATQKYGVSWGEWMGALAAAGTLRSAGPLENRGTVVKKDGDEELFLETVDFGGYAIVAVENEAEAIEIARSAPHVALGGSTIVRPVRAQP